MLLSSLLSELPGIILSALIVDRIGRKLSMASMFVLGCGFLMPLVVHQNGILTTGLLFGARMFIIGTFTIAFIYAPEVSLKIHPLLRFSFPSLVLYII